MTTLIDAWANAMLRASWQGGAALLLVWIICATCRRAAPGVKCWLWRLGVLKFLACLLLLVPLNLALLPAEKHEPAHAISAVLPLAPLPAMDETAPRTATEILPSPMPTVLSAATPRQPPQPRDGNPGLPAAHQANLPISKSTPNPTSPWLPFLFITWLLGITLYLSQIAKAFHRTQILRRSATPIDDPALHAACNQIATRLRLRRLPLLLATRDDSGPLLTGIVRPAILLPASLLERSPAADLGLILAHELAHLKRRDILWNLLQSVIDALFFFHPLIWLARRQSRHLQELACDDLTLAATQAAPAAYGKALLNVLAMHQTPRRPLAGVGVADSATTLRRRLLAMKTFQPATRRRIISAGILLTLAAILGILPWRVVAQNVPPVPTATPATTAAAAPAKATDTSHAGDSEKSVTQAIPIKFFPGFNNVEGPAGVRDQLKFFAISGPDTKVAVDEKNNTLILTGSAASVARLSEIIAEWEFEAAQGRNQAANNWNPGTMTPLGQPIPAPEPVKPEDMPPAVLEYPAILSVPILNIQTPVDGTVKEINVKEGQPVKKGDILFKLDDRAVRAAYDTANIKLESAEMRLQSAKKGADTGSVASKGEFSQAQNNVKLAEIELQVAQNSLDDLTIRAPFDGALQDFSVIQGQIITRGSTLTFLAAVGDLRVNVNIPTGAAASLQSGQRFTMRGESGEPVTGEIGYIAPIADAQSATIQVRGKLVSGNRLDRFKAGMHVSIYITPGPQAAK